MPAITNQVELDFVNQRLRPLAEQARAFVAQINDLEAQLLNVTFTDADTVEDRPELPVLTGAEVNTMIATLISTRNTAMADPAVIPLITKLSVRPLAITL